MNSDGGSICFDRAASFYDKTRALAPEADAELHRQLLEEVRGRRTLEIGVGTGRVGLPLHADGVELVGIDISSQMLARLRQNAGGTTPFPVLLADATRMPFADAAFGAAYASWVLHLISGWRQVIAEFVRVVSPGGIVVIGSGNWRRSVPNEIKVRFRDLAGLGADDWPRGPKTYEELDVEFARHGATPRPLPAVSETSTGTLEEEIRALEDGVFSVSWGVDETTRKRAADALRGWAEETFGSLTEERTFDHTHEWRAYDLAS